MAKFSLTEAAKAQLEVFKETQQEKLIKSIVEEKSYPGMDEIEISAQDIRLYSERIYFVRKRRNSISIFMSMVMLFIGMALVLVAGYYDALVEIYTLSPVRFIFIVYGVFCVLLSFISLLFVLQRNKLDKFSSDIDNKIRNLEKSQI